MKSKNNITGIILAGGKSSRMGTEKGLILYKNKPFVEHIIEAMNPLVDNIIIISNNKAYKSFGFRCYEDLIKNPLGEAKKIYSHFNIDLDIQTENSMVSYLAQSKRDPKRKHIYSPEEFGLSKEIIQNELSFSTKT